jgi:hypothetical protein
MLSPVSSSHPKRRLGMAEKNGSGSGKDWRELCVAASQEVDSDKLFSLVNQILEAFDEGDSHSVHMEPA